MRPSAQPFLWKWVEICMRMKNRFHVKGWSLNLVLIQRPGGTRKRPIEISMIQDFPLSHSSRGLTDAIFPLVNSRCHLEDTCVERFWTVILNAYKKTHEINNSERIPETSYAISVLLPLRYQADNNLPCIKSWTVLFNCYNYFSDLSPLQNFKVKRNLVTWT